MIVAQLQQRDRSGDDCVADDAADGPAIAADAVLRDALSELLAHEAQAGRVVDADGAVVGALSIAQLSHAIAATPEGS